MVCIAALLKTGVDAHAVALQPGGPEHMLIELALAELAHGSVQAATEHQCQRGVRGRRVHGQARGCAQEQDAAESAGHQHAKIAV